MEINRTTTHQHNNKWKMWPRYIIPFSRLHISIAFERRTFVVENFHPSIVDYLFNDLLLLDWIYRLKKLSLILCVENRNHWINFRTRWNLSMIINKRSQVYFGMIKLNESNSSLELIIGNISKIKILITRTKNY